MMDVKKPNKQTRHACVEVESWKKKNMWKCVLCWMQGEKNDEFGVM